jgi:hypothetical protein
LPITESKNDLINLRVAIASRRYTDLATERLKSFEKIDKNADAPFERESATSVHVAFV